MSAQGVTTLPLSDKYAASAKTLHQLRNPPELDDGLDPRATFAYVQFVDFQGDKLAIPGNVTVSMTNPDIHLIDFTPVNSTDRSLWRLRLYGGLPFNAYRARIIVAGYAPQVVTLDLERVLLTQPTITVAVTGVIGGVSYTVTGVVANVTTTVTGTVGF
jgi:hypothetical protein